MMTPSIVFRLASGKTKEREEAIKIFLKWIRSNQDRSKWPTWALYMSEVASPCPDLILRSKYRKMLIEETP